MSRERQPTPPSSGGGGSPTCATTGTCPHCTVSIQEAPRCCAFVPSAGVAPAVTLHAVGQDPGGTYTWRAMDPAIAQVTGAGDTANVSGLQTGVTDIEVAYACPGGGQARATIRCVAYRAAIDHPSGDPVASGSATNEFTFNTATPGVVTIPCRARITPNTPDAISCAGEHLRWTIDSVGASALAWNNADPANAAEGKGVEATASFTGLPNNNTDFGTKTVTLLLDNGTVIQTTTVEVFWPKNAMNHPDPDQGATPNWFFYWMQVIGNPAQARYGGAGPGGRFGETLAMTQWSYPAVADKTLIHIYNSAATSDGAIAGLHGPLTGVDLFENTVLHETEHTRQIARADPVVGIHPGTCWTNGWSWNVPNHNHWQLGPGRAAGAGGICTAAGPGTMGAPGTGDVLLEAPNPPGNPFPTSDWPTAWGPIPPGAGPGGTYIGGDHMEQQAFQQETSPEHARARQDWGDPGKNHRTLNRFND